MNFHQLECFLTVVQEGNISNAAKKLYVSESSISQIIHKIESELGVPLFNRASRRLALTYAGRQYLNTAAGIMQMHRNFMREISGLDSAVSGEMTLSLSEKRVKEFLPSVLPVFLNKYPNIHIKLLDQQAPIEIREKQLLDGKCDLLVSNHKFMHNSIENIPICHEHLVLIISKKSGAVSRLFPTGKIPSIIPIKALQNEKLILQQQPYHSRVLAEQIFQSADFIPNLAIEVTSIGSAKALALTGIGCALCNDILSSKHSFNVDRGDHYSILIDHPLARREVLISYNRMYQLSSFHKTFIQIMAETFE